MGAHESMEHAEHAEHASGSNKNIALLIAVIALFLAFSETLGKGAQTDSISKNVEASNLWAFFQAKSIRRTVVEATSDQARLSLGVTAFIFDLTRPKLLQMQWFAKIYEWVLALRAKAAELVNPIKLRIREAMRSDGDGWLSRTRQLIQRFRKNAHEAR